MKNFLSNLKTSIQKNIDHIMKKDILNEITIKYRLDKLNKEEAKIRIFGDKFVENNKNNVILRINGEEHELCEYINGDMIPNDIDILEVVLVETQPITNMSYIFSYCNSLLPISDFSNWNTRNVTDMSSIFAYCNELKSLPDISNFYTKNVTNMNQMFSFCNSLLNLPDISNWKVKHVENMSWMFAHCESLTDLPDISRWKTKNVKNMSYMFYSCYSLANLPDISGWNIGSINKTFGMTGMFEGCKKSLNIPRKFKV